MTEFQVQQVPEPSTFLLVSGIFVAAARRVTGLFNFEDGAFATAVRTFVLSPAVIAAANLADEFRVSISRVGAIAFDYFQLNAETAAVPEPAMMLLLGLGGIGALMRRLVSRV